MLKYTVSDVANRLQISEFEVFRRAWLQYFGSEAWRPMLERVFGEWIMGKREMPHWVRHYLRQYLHQYHVTPLGENNESR